ncbi:MAG: YjfB family protein [Oscillospiraceae bacterium]|nr:YjfB family protein [Oscillospiraceae bacterium]
MDLTSYIAAMSTNMAQYNVQTAVSIGMLKNSMESAEAVNAQLIEMMDSVPMPSSGVGSLLDVRA